MARNNKNNKKGNMSVNAAGKKGSESVHELIEKGKQKEY